MTSIEWTDCTWNCVRGCARVSKGCEHCYAEGVARRFAGPGQPYEGLVRLGKDGKPRAQWNGEVRFVPEKLAEPLSWRKPRRVFVNSMSDLFHEGLTFEQIDRVFAAMLLAPQHSYQILTKRPARLAEYLGAQRFGQINEAARDIMEEQRNGDALIAVLPTQRHGMVPFPRIPWWLGVSVEDQATANTRIPALLAARSSTLFGEVSFVSYEPALGPVRFGPDEDSSWLGMRCDWGHLSARGGGTYVPGKCAAFVGSYPCGATLRTAIDWIVVGGESGRGARPCALEWLSSTVAQCRAAGVPVFVKQLGACVVSEERVVDDPEEQRALGLSSRWAWGAGLRDPKGGDPSEWPEDLRVREWPEVRHA